MDSDWVNSKEAAEMIGVTNRTLYRFIDRGEIPAYKIGRVLRVQRSAVEAFLRRQQVQPGELSHLYAATKKDRKVVDEAGFV